MTTPFRIAYNINCEASHRGANRQAAVDEQIALHSAFTLAFEDYKSGFYFTKQIQARSPETEVIHRRYWYVDPNNPQAGGWDGSLHRAPGITADGILNTFEQAQVAHGVKVIEQLYCEPSVHVTPQDPQGVELRKMLKLDVDCMKGASGRAMRLAVDIGQSVTWVQKEFDDGFYDELLFTFAAYPQHFLSVHEYALGDLWFNTSKANLALLSVDKELARSYANYFTTAGSDNLQRDYVVDPSEAHLGRVEILAERCRKIGVPIPKMIYTEIGWDRTRIGQQTAVDNINQRTAMGYPTLYRYWNTRYPQWIPSKTAFEQVKWLNRAMPDYVVGACLFGKDTAFEAGNYHIEDATFQELLSDYSAEVRQGTTVPMPPFPPKQPTPPTPTDYSALRPLVDDTIAALTTALAASERLKRMIG